MALYIYRISDGLLMSWSPGDNGQVADDATLAAKGFAKVSGLLALDATHVWDAPTKTVVVIATLHPVVSLNAFWQRFTSTEREAIEGQFMTGTQGVKNAISAFFRYVQAAGSVDLNDSYVRTKVTQLETIGTLTAGRAAVILA